MSVRAILALALIALVALATPALAEDRRVGVDVTIAPTSEGVVATYRLARPVTRFQFEYDGGKLGHQYWTIKTPGMTFQNGDVVSNTGSFDVIEIAAAAHNDLTDATYPSVIGIGDRGRVMYLSAFAGKQDVYRTTLDLVPAAADQVVLGLPGASRTLVVNRSVYNDAAPIYAYIGPSAYVRKTSRATYVFGPEVPPWIPPDIERLANRSLDFFMRKEELAHVRETLIFITIHHPD